MISNRYAEELEQENKQCNSGCRTKCKNCQWYNKPYWSIINPCDNCDRENTNMEILTRWQDPTINEYKKEIKRLHSIIKKAIHYILSNDLDNFDNINELLNILKDSDKE